MNCKSSCTRNSKKKTLKKTHIKDSSISKKSSKGLVSEIIRQKSNKKSKMIGSNMKRVIKKEITKNLNSEKPIKGTHKKNISSKLPKRLNKNLVDEKLVKKAPEIISKDTSIKKGKINLKSASVKVVKKIDKKGNAGTISKKTKISNPVKKMDVSKNNTNNVLPKNSKTSSKLINKFSSCKTRMCNISATKPIAKTIKKSNKCLGSKEKSNCRRIY